ncbi:siderophore-interacting protein [Streptomyces sp. GC420]|uniref:siderophore-interacting protein n=1 Tax=Streptomyces sp. GC420 TaxID=2697568 RepID=UPI001414DDF7|nr:siderophore-interacting protein [Streptomyces sp. GC420]NBM19915.1 SIP domain-containing protein [Streptomyces sp. GC420]
MTTAVTAPFRFFGLHVVRTERLGPSMARISFGGEQLKGFSAGGRDQSLSLFLPQPGQDVPVIPTGENWFAGWRAIDPGVRAVMRSYTVRRQRGGEIDIDFALHGVGGTGACGPAARWAAAAGPGDRVTVLGPAVADNSAVRFRPPGGTDWVLIAADETALPAAAGILEWLPPGTKAKVWLDVPTLGDRQNLLTLAEADVTWLTHGDGAGVLESVRAAELPSGTPYAWIAGESGTVRALRRHLVGERGFDRRAVTFAGYWRRGLSEEQLRDQGC